VYARFFTRRHALMIPNGTSLAIDLGKFNSVLCWYDSATRTSSFRTV
jgi:hypothetical protein